MFNAIKKFSWVLLALLLARPAWAAEAVAMVTDIKGTVTIMEDGDSDKLRMLAYLQAGSEIELGKDGKLVITYFSKPQEFVFTGPAKLRINADGPQVLKGQVAEARDVGTDRTGTAKKFSTMQRERLAQATFEMRASKPGIRLVGPINTALLSVNPELTWFGPNDATEFTVTLMDEGGKEIKKLNTIQPAWRIPAEAALKPGAAYQWKVETTLRSGETLSAAGHFTVMEEKRAREIAAAHPKPGAEFSERVLYAAKLETEGLKYEAKTEWQALSKERPDDLVLQEKAVR